MSAEEREENCFDHVVIGPELAESMGLQPTTGVTLEETDATPIVAPITSAELDFGTTQPAKNLSRYMDGWLSSDYPNPTHAFTIIFPHESLKSIAQKSRKTLTGYVGKKLQDLPPKFRELGIPWLAVWVVETKHWPHVHGVLNIPPEHFDEIHALLTKQFPPRLLPRAFPSIGTDFHPPHEPCTSAGIWIEKLSDSRRYKATDRSGLLGWLDYSAKAIDHNASRTRGLGLGRMVSASREISGLCRRREVQGVWR